MPTLDEFSQSLIRAWAYVTNGRTLAIIFGVGFALLAILLLVASRTKWGHAKPLTKCVVLSVLAHVWLLMYALGNRTILPQGDPGGREQNMTVAFEPMMSPTLVPNPPALSDPAAATLGRELETWEQPVPLADLPKPAELESLLADTRLPALPELLPLLAATPLPDLPPDLPPAEEFVDANQPDEARSEAHSELAATPPLTELQNSLQSAAEIDTLANALDDTGVDSPSEPSNESPYEALADSANDLLADQTGTALDGVITGTADPTAAMMAASQSSPAVAPDPQLPQDSPLPPEYRMRQAPNRLQQARNYGADEDSEAAVEAALMWLASSQGPDGSWNAKQYGAGTETRALGLNRQSTGDRADTGISGLALLAFLSAGHTHLDGKYAQTVDDGLRYLQRVQHPSGDLSGPKQLGWSEPSVVNARMYCHSIATLALAEALAMSRDPAVRESVMKATQYSLDAQDPRGGGWRYRLKEPGDLSQFGWQAMALKSADRSGILIPAGTRQGMLRFLDSCSAGTYGGLARYRPREGFPSETMSAEALACRLLLGIPPTPQARQEANEIILRNRPQVAQQSGAAVPEDNVYFWYYATLALFQQQDENWRVWNQALKAKLITTQVPAWGEQPGSWEPDRLWGGYGGRVYSTAMSCMCLEVYYRYLPMYQSGNIAGQAPSSSRR